MALARVHNVTVSLDGHGTGAGTSHAAFFGLAGERVRQWMFATRWREPGGSGPVVRQMRMSRTGS